MVLEKLVVGPLQANCYIVGCESSHEALVIDPGGEPERIIQRLQFSNLRAVKVVGTHAHLDHVLGAKELCAATGAPLLLHRDEMQVLASLREWTRMWLGFDPGAPPEVGAHLGHGDTITLGNLTLQVVDTPGHSPGSVSLVMEDEGAVFVGDLLFQGSIGRSDLPGGDHATLIRSVEERIFPLGDGVIVYSGHGPETTVGRERTTNPFFAQSAGRRWR